MLIINVFSVVDCRGKLGVKEGGGVVLGEARGGVVLLKVEFLFR